MSEAKQRATRLMRRKEDVEEEMEGYYGTLQMHGVTLSTPLVDSQGFPRADIDVYAIRHARAALIRLRNDHRSIVDELGGVLEEIYKKGGELPDPTPRAVGGGGARRGSGRVDREGRMRAIARVNMVASNSPAEKAGLRQHDEIVRFGTLESPSGLQDIAALVGRFENSEIILLIRRKAASASGSTSSGTASEEDISLRLVPTSGWGGRGTLGCHILPP